MGKYARHNSNTLFWNEKKKKNLLGALLKPGEGGKKTICNDRLPPPLRSLFPNNGHCLSCTLNCVFGKKGGRGAGLAIATTAAVLKIALANSSGCLGQVADFLRVGHLLFVEGETRGALFFFEGKCGVASCGRCRFSRLEAK